MRIRESQILHQLRQRHRERKMHQATEAEAMQKQTQGQTQHITLGASESDREGETGSSVGKEKRQRSIGREKRQRSIGREIAFA